ncbi:aminotransferase class V-fold PLP-dependent enzyme [Clostridium sp. HMP27]|uniref:aminotransferase class V-fold PLP-dependent enzyme n=1 Tax=Clostridium sp. HMP27 TaxID=1487921 RepID=UPI00052D43A6|nr:aminotransferase class V-fold PLP-dependent enzyme [Clostridium sp. HMP27]KGK86060.1 hypothetical protein DP68_14650 [Clostridium sp. HMP27]
MNYLEKRLAEYFKKRFCCFTGSGTTAIYLILKALNLQQKKILYPSISCMVPVNAALYAGYDVVFCDVSLKDYTMDLNAFENTINKYDIGIVVPTHIYGHICDMKKISRIAHEKGIFILEDAAQTVSLSNDSDASIMSFGHTKILETENGGGAIFTDNENLYNKLKEEKDLLPKKPRNLGGLFDEYRKNYYSIMNNENKSVNKYKEIYNLQLNSKDAFIYDMDNNEEVIEQLANIEEIKRERNKRANLYGRYLHKSLIHKAKCTYEILWRYSFLYKGDREQLLYKIREKGIDVSSWYPALYKFYSQQEEKEFSNSQIVEKQIVNLWVNEKYSQEKILHDIQSINFIMGEGKFYYD